MVCPEPSGSRWYQEPCVLCCNRNGEIGNDTMNATSRYVGLSCTVSVISCAGAVGYSVSFYVSRLLH